jgi:hypothetical protein
MAKQEGSRVAYVIIGDVYRQVGKLKPQLRGASRRVATHGAVPYIGVRWRLH